MKCYIIGLSVGIILIITSELVGLFDITAYGSTVVVGIDNSTVVSPCDNKERYNPSMPLDHSTTIDNGSAQLMFNSYTTDNPAPYGAWLGKELIDTIFTMGDYNGISVLLGKDINGTNCFMIKGSKGTFRTMPLSAMPPDYFRLDAMCPAYCDGLTSP